MKKHYKTVILSDIHMGKPNAQLAHLVNFLSGIEMNTLIINGDFIDFRQLTILRKRGEHETNLMNHIIALTEKGTKLIYVKGNHDTFIKHFNNIKIHNMHIVNDLFYTTSNNKKYYICHGEKFDFICNHLPSFAKIVNFLYTLLYFLEKLWNKNISKPGYIAFSEKFKHFLRKYLFPWYKIRRKCSTLAKQHNCHGLIFGHYHYPLVRKIHNIECINTGDWIVNCSAVVEHLNGDMELIYHT